MALLRGSVLALLLAGCGDSSTGTGGAAGAAGAGGAGGGGAAAACSCEVVNGVGLFDDKACFCADTSTSMCESELTIDAVLQPSCPGPLLHPISPSCKIGGLLFPADGAADGRSYGYYFDRDTDELVGLYVATDASDYCESMATSAHWGDVAASCELCDPCGDSPDFPACPDPPE